MTEPTVREILEGAVTSLETEGWRKGSPGLSAVAMPHCALGAIRRAAFLQAGYDNDFGLRGPWRKADIALFDALPKWYHDRHHGVPTWNDARGRTKEQVIEVFQRAIKNEIAKEEQSNGD